MSSQRSSGCSKPTRRPARARPSRTLEQLDALVRRVRHAGLPVELRVDGEPSRLAPGVDASAYRVIQEALTNALKHGGDAATA